MQMNDNTEQFLCISDKCFKSLTLTTYLGGGMT